MSDLRSELDRACAVLQDEIASCTTVDQVVTMLEGRVAEMKGEWSSQCQHLNSHLNGNSRYVAR